MRTSLVLVCLWATVFCFGCGADDNEAQPAQLDVQSDDVYVEPQVPDEPLQTGNTMSEEKQKMESYYAPLGYEVEAEIEPYELPLAPDDIDNFDVAVASLGLEGKTDKLLENGFVVVPYGEVEDIVEPYKYLKESPVPTFVTVDTWLHLYHIQFDELLKELEETIFYFDILAITDTLLANAEKSYAESDGLLQEAARRNVAFLRVARELLVVEDDPETIPEQPVPDYVAADVIAELKLIADHSGFEYSPLFIYKEDYSQYVPRGHYTRSERLKSYFRALMWYGRITMLLKGAPDNCETDECEALISEEDADVQTVQALMLSLDMDNLDTGQGTVMQLWERLYLATAFFVGFADDLTVYEYLDSVAEVLGQGPDQAELAKAENLFDLRASLAQKRSPQIYGGTGGQMIIVEPGEEITPDMLAKLLDKTKGFRFMGQRFIPDSYIMGRLVSPGAGELAPAGDQTAFTAVVTPAGVVRGFPRGLDVMAVLGSARARGLLTELKDDAYTKYDETFAEMKEFLDSQTEAQWHSNLYWGWLYALDALLAEPGVGTQSFMQTDAYLDRRLTAGLASWAELRHDTILYAKQSYTPDFGTTSEPPPPPPPPAGYVEPNPEFYARLFSLNEMTRTGLEDMGLLPDAAKWRLESLSDLLARMLDITIIELSGAELSADDLWFIDELAESLESTVTGVDDAGTKTTLVADVHTDGNSKQVLEEAVGYVQLMVVAYRLPDGTITLGAGPVMSYYEFKHPMSNRLTDEEWRDMLAGPENLVPPAPPWTASYVAQ